MKLLSVINKKEPRYIVLAGGCLGRGRRQSVTFDHSLIVKSEDELLREFEGKVRGRPKGIGCVVKYGHAARALGVPYQKAFAIVSKHFKRLRGYTHQSWIEKGFFTGYNDTGLIA